MRLTKTERLYDYPAKTVRDLFRKHYRSGFDAKTAAACLGVSVPAASKLIRLAVADGRLQALPVMKGWYALTTTGNQLALATFRHPIERANAAQSLQAFLQRVKEVDSNPHYMFGVARVALFGSLLAGADEVSDVDVAIELTPRTPDRDYLKRMHERADIARAKGVSLRDSYAVLTWPREEVIRALKGADRRISVHGFDDLIGLGCPYKMLYPTE